MNADALKGKIREYAMTQGEVAIKIGCSLSRFNAKLNSTNGAEFTLGEIRKLKQLFQLTPEQTDSIFLS